MKRTFAIGDIQGCLDPLKRLLERINYDPTSDSLWFTGDLVNRGPKSLLSLRFIKSLPNTISVLGNHDLALIAVYYQATHLRSEDNFDEVLTANDAPELIQWLRMLPLLHTDTQLGFTMTHAGIYPAWSLAQATSLANEVEALLRGELFQDYLNHMFGQAPNQWHDELRGWDRARFITNAFTRMRYCTQEGLLDFDAKGTLIQHQDKLPWFNISGRPTQNDKLIFGHWSALQGVTNNPRVIALDTGCVWGNCLTALCLETQQSFSIECK